MSTALAETSPTEQTTPAKPKVGRPRRFTNIDDFYVELNSYFTEQDAAQKPYTMAGLCRRLGISPQTLWNYSNRNAERSDFSTPEFVEAVKMASLAVLEGHEERLAGGRVHPGGLIFLLKNHFGYKDIQEHRVDQRVAVLGVQVDEDARRVIAEQLLRTLPHNHPQGQITSSSDLSLVPHNDLPCGNQSQVEK